MSRMTLAEKEYIRGRVGAEFAPVVNGLRDRLLPLTQKVTAQLYRSLGLAAAEKEILTLVKRLEKLNAQFEAVAGVECIEISVKHRPDQIPMHSHDRWAATPFAREVRAKVHETREAQSLNEAEAKCVQMQDTVMLAGFPEQLVTLIEKELPQVTGKFSKLLGNGNGNGRKRLTAA